MKISFITIHVGRNFGSVLQCIATAKVLEKFATEVLLIDYRPDRVTHKRYWQLAFTSPLRFLRRVLAYPIILYNEHLYQGFLAKFCRMSKPIYSEDDFVNACPISDIYITGSDQVWNSIHNEGLDLHYYFNGIKGKKIAYASSFGCETLPDDEYQVVKNMLGAYTAISVREKGAQALVESMGYKAEHLLDPTFMLNCESWKPYISRRKVNDPYVLVYIPYNIQNEDLILDSVNILAKKKNLKTITFSWDFRNSKNADKTMKYCNPSDFLSLIYYSDFVITNSFHGTAFSINLNKQFWTFLPSGFGIRIRSIIELCNLSNRIKDTVLTLEDIETNISYNSVNEILDNERDKAITFLANSIKS